MMIDDTAGSSSKRVSYYFFCQACTDRRRIGSCFCTRHVDCFLEKGARTVHTYVAYSTIRLGYVPPTGTP
eukprot:scaffold3150_cov51-Attheya_sp.AAC.11